MFSSAVETGWLVGCERILSFFLLKKKNQTLEANTGSESQFASCAFKQRGPAWIKANPGGRGNGTGFRLSAPVLSLLGHCHHGSSSWQRPSVHFRDQTGNWKPLKLRWHFSFYLNPSAETFEDLTVSNHTRHASISVNSLEWKHDLHLTSQMAYLDVGLHL